LFLNHIKLTTHFNAAKNNMWTAYFFIRLFTKFYEQIKGEILTFVLMIDILQISWNHWFLLMVFLKSFLVHYSHWRQAASFWSMSTLDSGVHILL
jgi:hypothetical protein